MNETEAKTKLYKLRCSLCGVSAQDLNKTEVAVLGAMAVMQAHGQSVHNIPRGDIESATHKRSDSFTSPLSMPSSGWTSAHIGDAQIEDYQVWILPDGREWLRAEFAGYDENRNF